MKRTILSTAVAILAAGAMSANAANDLKNWSYQALHDDERMTQILGAEVYTSGGEEIGNIEDVYINERGEIQTVVIGTGGIILTDEYVSVPWKNAEYFPLAEGLRIPQTEQQVEALEKNKAINPGPNQWSAQKLIDMTANVDGTKPYGEIDDLMVDVATGKVDAIVVEPDVWDPSRYAVPWDGSILKTANEGYVYLPYTEPAIASIGVFVYPVDSGQQLPSEATSAGNPNSGKANTGATGTDNKKQ